MASLYSAYESFCRDEASAMENKQQKPQSYLFYKTKFRPYNLDYFKVTVWKENIVDISQHWDSKIHILTLQYFQFRGNWFSNSMWKHFQSWFY